MPKRYGESYNPALRKTDHGSKLYWIWKKVRPNTDCEEFSSFVSFYNWAMENGYESGDRLLLIDNTLPYSPDNCDWKIVPGKWVDDWNKAVNRIRKYYGMPPLEDTDYGD